jgi:hypothetical protein
MSRRAIVRPRLRRSIAAVCAITTAIAITALSASAASAASAHDPIGSLDSITQTGTGVSVVGWTADIDTRDPLAISVTVNGHPVARVLANVARPSLSVAAKLGPNHGFAVALTLPAAARDVICVDAANRGQGSNHVIGCRTVAVSFNPHGSLDSVRSITGGLAVVGGATDPNFAGIIDVDITVDSVVRGRLTANTAIHHGHGFAAQYIVAEGRHTVCAVGINRGAGKDAPVGCRVITLNFSPVGAIVTLIPAAGGIHLTGWAHDPDTSAPIHTAITVNGATVGSMTANLAAGAHGAHGFAATYSLAAGKLAPGTYTVCAVGTNLGTYGTTRNVSCKRIALNFNPTGGIQTLVQVGPGIAITGWVKDPDTGAAINAAITVDGVVRAQVLANGRGKFHTRYEFAAKVTTTHGVHAVCVVGINVLYGSGNGAPVCRSFAVSLTPRGAFEHGSHSSRGITVSGWAADFDASHPVSVTVSVDGTVLTSTTTHILRPDVVKAHPGAVAATGFSVTVATSEAEHRVCLVAVNQGGGHDLSLGCRIVNALHPKVPSPPRAVKATGGYLSAAVSWSPPLSDGGAPWTSYVLTVVPTGAKKRLAAGTTSTTVVSLKAKTAYRFTIQAQNVAGLSGSTSSPVVTTQTGPPPQRTPAPISTSRYVRNVSSATATDLNTMRAEGAADAARNPSGHRYLVLLDIGGQDESQHGVLLSATTHFVSYANLVRDLNAYADGYIAHQRSGAPATIAIGTNNDMDVSTSAGISWARSVVNPVAAHVAAHTGVRIAGANDAEPGFRGTYAQTRAWLSGYFNATHSQFVFNGSADGCAWTATARGCNNGWTMGGLYNLSAGVAPTRIVDLPQVYNNTMAAQWKYISLTGVAASQPRINFGGALTEWTACAQSHSCGSLTGTNAWIQMWNQLQSHPALRVNSLPYSTDLRIDR